MAAMVTEDVRFEIAMVETGDDDDEASFRLRNVPWGEMQRQHILQCEASTLVLQADLVSVVHGTLLPDGPAASILVVDFRFLGSRSHGRRFRHARIDVGFAHGDDFDSIGNMLDPQVMRIAPFGSFARDPSVQETETKISTQLSANAPAGLATFGGGWERTKAGQKTAFTTLQGMMRIEGRVFGGQNAARWEFSENDNDRHGIPAALRVAVLVQPKDSGSFVASITVDAKVDVLHGAIMAIKRFRGKAVVDPIYFAEEGDREPLRPELLGEVDEENLCEVNLDAIPSIGPSDEHAHPYK